ncbi:MAG: DEAD/DEAH box helicase, partial [Bacteroidota bacterium]
MDVFELDRKLIADYSSYIRSFVQISDQRISQVVEQELAEGLLWPEALIQLNPAFKAGPTVEELVNAGKLHRECAKIFRVGKAEGEGRPLRLHQHQADALAAARSGANYVLTTGTGSGKSLAYILPIVDYVLRHGSGKGIKAIIVYPMNALANSQEGELEKFLCEGYPEGRPPVTFRRYTGQESTVQRDEIRHNPPDILLTNYVMMELLLTRPEERKSLIEAAQGLRFLVLDELHTYRGRQGADVAMLVRRVRNACGGEELQCIGTSATMSSGGTVTEQKQEVAAVASLLFGSPVTPDRVVGETLRRATPEHDSADQDFVKSLAERIENGPRGAFANVSAFLADPLSSWIESTLGLRVEPGSGVLVRAVPQPIRGASGVARQLAELTGQPEERCAASIQEALLAGHQLRHPDTGLPVFAFRLHQFISRGEAVYASLEAEPDRYITVHGQQYVPEDRTRLLWPLAFCRECGQEYYPVWGRKQSNGDWAQFYPRDLGSQEPEEEGLEAGYLYMSTKEPWPTDEAGVLERVPPDWLEPTAAGERIRPGQRKHVPQSVEVGPDGTVGAGVACHYQRAPFHLCLKCDVSYSSTRSNDAGRLATLGTGGRSTSTTILSLSAVRHLRHDESLAPEAQKLLSFTDNRQDASLQAGHLNDFVGVGLVRAGLLKALNQAGPTGLTHEQLTQSVFEALALPLADYAGKKDVRYAARTATDQALREVLGYRIYRDLSRGWRVSSPNLEQCGLLEIAYESLAELSADDSLWDGKHEALVTATPEQRKEVCRVLLDLMRRELAIRVRYLDPVAQDQIRQLSEQWLREPWALDERESYQMEQARVLLPRARGRDEQRRNALFVSAQSGFGRYLRRTTTFPNYRAVHDRLKLDDTLDIIGHLLSALDEACLIQKVGDDGGVPEYQLAAGCMRWKAGDGTRAYQDVIRVPRASANGGRTNQFFVDFYREVALDARGIRAHEHTAQVTYDDRVEREKQFRTGELPVLYCSPTMELGVDISQLNVVNMRNMPPTPANYAQRSGRAGRSGQPALVFTYCSTGSPHDQYFYREPQR